MQGGVEAGGEPRYRPSQNSNLAGTFEQLLTNFVSKKISFSFMKKVDETQILTKLCQLYKCRRCIISQGPVTCFTSLFVLGKKTNCIAITLKD